ncbi:MAG: SDR family oxidoreductase [Candidatus Cloacimonetes bacterium]|nr:SDR family oxidoreductase [Candidatus Cloacimonadota bacterium]
MFNLKNKKILISGASGGIGRTTAKILSSIGADCVLIGRDEKRLEETLRGMHGGNHQVFAQDITEYDALKELVKQAVADGKPFDGMVHCAGIETVLPLKILKPEHFEKSFSINVIAGFELAKHVIKKKHFNENGGSLLFLSSVMGSVGSPVKAAYCSSKGALIGGMKALALELAPKKIRVNTVSPAMVVTGMSKALLAKVTDSEKEAILKAHPLGLGEPEDVAWVCAFLLSDASRWITGTDLKVDGGYTAQ